MKKAMIDQILLGGFLLVVFIVFVATVSDEKAAREKVYDLKKITDTAVLAMGNYYMFVNPLEDKDTAEQISNSILDETKLGTDVKPIITYTWDEAAAPKTVTATVSNYRQKNFWYTLLDLNDFTLNVSSTGILDNGETNVFVPIVVNGCTRTFNEGDEFDYLLKAYDLYDPTDNVGFFGAYDPSSGQSSFAHLKNLVDDVMKEKDSYFDLDEDLNVATVEADEIENDVKQIAQAFAISSFTDTPMSIVEAKCGSTADNLVIERVFEITMQGVYCGDGCLNPGINNCLLTDTDGSIFTDMDWDTAVNTCNSNQFFRIHFRIDKIREREVILQ